MPQRRDCVFCEIITRKREAPRLMDQTTWVTWFEPLNPVVSGHMLFLPNIHVDEAGEKPKITARVFKEAAMWAAEKGESFNLITSSGFDASQTIRHLHVHYVPRRERDGLMLPWGGVRG